MRDCRCDDGAIARYRRRLSGPLLDRIDLHVRVPAVPWHDLDDRQPDTQPSGDASPAIRARVAAARSVQANRLRGLERVGASNSAIPPSALHELVHATPDARTTLARAVEALALTARTAHRMLRVARTIADLAGGETVGPGAIAEALSFWSEG